MNISYLQTQTERTGFLGLGGSQVVTRQKEMSVEDFFGETSKALEGKSEDSANRVYDQESINNALWNYADENGDGYINEEEYSALIYSIVAGNNETNDFSGIPKLAAGVFGAAIVSKALEAAKFSSTDKGMTLEQVNAYMDLIETDNANNLDANGDGKITRDEFENAACTKILTENQDN